MVRAGVKQQVAIVGVGYSTVGRETGLTLTDLAAQASAAALADAGLSVDAVDGLAVHSFLNQFLGVAEVCQATGLRDLRFFSASGDGPAYVVSAAHAVAAIASGQCHTCLTLRVVRRGGGSGGSRFDAGQAQGMTQFLAPYGAFSPPHWAALYKQRYQAEFALTDVDLAAFPVQLRRNAASNPEALLRDPLTVDSYLESPVISTPLRVLDCDYLVDAGAALIFTSLERARDLRRPLVVVDQISLATSGTANPYYVEDMARPVPSRIRDHFWKATDFTPADVQVACLYDGFSFFAGQWLEGLGFCGSGDAPRYVSQDDSVGVNLDGGACNVGRRHGASYFIEATRQLRGECGLRQVPNARAAIVTNGIGGFAGAALLRAGA